MGLNKSNLINHLDAIKKFVSDRASQTEAYLSIKRDLETIQASFANAKKLTLQILSADREQTKALHNLLSMNSDLQDLYDFKTSSLPEIPDPNAPPPPPTLVLQAFSGTQPSVRYELKTSQSQVIGRNPAVTQILLPDNLSLVGGSHAELRPVEGNWQIRDSGSRNGTFINGKPQKLQDWYTLKSGDRICLGSATQIPDSATLVFEIPSTESIHAAYAEAKRLLTCNILCLVIPPQPLTGNVQRFIQLAKDAHIAKIFIIADRPGGITAKAFKEPLAEIENSAKSQLQSTPFQLISLLLKPFTPSSGATVLVPHAQPEFERFCEALIALSKENNEAILAEWGTNKLKQIVNQIEAILVQQDAALKEKLQNNEERFKELSQGNLKKQVEKVYKKVDGERDSFFRQVKTELSQSKGGLLDEFRQNSLPSKIQQFAKQLQPHVSDQGGYRYVRLKLRTGNAARKSSNEVHAAATEICHTELTRWATTEWNRIRSEYYGGGLDALLKKSYESLNFIPELVLPEDGFSTTQNLSIHSMLNNSSVEPEIGLRYKQVGFWGYMFKNLRGQIITIVGTIATLGSGLIPNDAKNILIPALIPFTLCLVWLSHKQEKEAKVEESTEKLQKETASYYQSYSKNLVDRIMQLIGGLLESEEKRFRGVVDDIKEIYTSYIAELDETQKQLKSQLDEMKRSGQSKIEKDLVELRKLKQSL